jgi:hypothetical protein
MARLRRRRLWPAALAVAGCIASCAFTLAQAGSDQGPPVALTSIHPDPNSTVDFDVKSVGSVSWASIANDSLADVNLNSGTYRAVVDRSKMKPDVASHQFGFTLYVNRTPLFQQTVYAYDISERCTGVFNDTVQSVNVSIGAGQSLIAGSISLPLHSPFGASHPLLSPYSNPNPPYSGLNPSAPAPVNLSTGSQKTFTVTATSNLNLMLAQLGDATATIDCGPCLQTPIPVQLSTTDLEPNSQLTVTVTANPNLWQAMSASRHPETDQYDAILNIAIPFTAGEQGEFGATATAVIPVEVKFAPSSLLTALGVVGGTLIGAFLRMWLAWIPKKSWDWREFALGAVIAIVCWLIAAYAASGGILFIKLFGVTFNPTQTLAAFLICLIVGGGPALLKLIEESLPGGKQ